MVHFDRGHVAPLVLQVALCATLDVRVERSGLSLEQRAGVCMARGALVAVNTVNRGVADSAVQFAMCFRQISWAC